MPQQEAIKLFEQAKIRTVWDEDQEKWFFSVVDVVEVLTDSANPTDYLKKMRKRDPELGEFLGTNCPQVQMTTVTGKKRLTLAGDSEQILRVIQSIPSPKAEPFKRWLAKVGAERLNQLQDPELSIQQALRDYKRLGYSDNWINQRLKSIEIRKDLTDEWDQHGVQEGQEYATLTDIIYQAWSGKTARQYKKFKGLKKENLRDNMTNEELVLNMLAELSATSITRARDPKTLDENKQCAAEGGDVARVAREELEAKTGREVVSPLSAKRFFEGQEPKLELEDKEED